LSEDQQELSPTTTTVVVVVVVEKRCKNVTVVRNFPLQVPTLTTFFSTQSINQSSMMEK
jgi:hypothetical protein